MYMKSLCLSVSIGKAQGVDVERRTNKEEKPKKGGDLDDDDGIFVDMMGVGQSAKQAYIAMVGTPSGPFVPSPYLLYSLLLQPTSISNLEGVGLRRLDMENEIREDKAHLEEIILIDTRTQKNLDIPGRVFGRIRRYSSFVVAVLLEKLVMMSSGFKFSMGWIMICSNLTVNMIVWANKMR
ncbi:hypothetical protein EV359DRAFT_68747 [Lentinula novae-zelandiae]|nr:hypothetical protein EV359DRAFT_68747 [Lentinula novae-zelandiae]